MKNVVRKELGKIWDLFIKWILMFINGEEESIEATADTLTVINQYSIIKWNMNLIWNDASFNIDRHVLNDLWGLTDLTRKMALNICCNSLSEYERRYMNGILKEMTDVQDQIEDLISKYGYTLVPAIDTLEQSRLARYTLAKMQYGARKYNVVNAQ